MPRTRLAALGCIASLSFGGCLNPWNTRFPQAFPGSAQAERQTAQIQDPYPDADLGPSTGFRPLGYQDPRPESLRVKERAGAAFIRQQYGQPNFPALGPSAGGEYYPEAVRQ